MAVWKLKPVARKDDPHWSGYDYRDPLLVEASNPAEARLKATDWYKARFQLPEQRHDGQFYRSAFEDTKLYELTELSGPVYQTELERYPVAR